jgi:signal transduction histidine kinase
VVSVACEASADALQFTVTDTGSGLPASIRQNLFVPVASTKPGGGGMGLAISSRLARHAGGTLSLVRSDASGTQFALRVPLARS